MLLARGTLAGQTYEHVPHAMQSFEESFSAFAKSPLMTAL
jgi:hypothetical protein